MSSQLPQGFINWVTVKDPKLEHVSFPNFVKRFKLTNKEDAIQQFELLICSSSVRQSRQQRLKGSFNNFQMHYMESFWSKYALDLKTKITALNAGTIIQDLGFQQAKISSEQLISSNEGDQSKEPLEVDEITKEAKSNIGDVKSSDIVDDSDESGSETAEEISSPLQAPSPTVVPTENIDSPLIIGSNCALPNLIQAYNADDMDDTDDDDHDDHDQDIILIPDNTDLEFNFVGNLNGLDLAVGFKSYFAAVKKKTVYIEDTDEALGRSGIIFLANTGSTLQLEHLGKDTLTQIKVEMLKYWHTADVSASRSRARAWLDANKNYVRSEILIELTKSYPEDPMDRKLWAFLVSAVSNFPVKDVSKSYSESTGISSYVLPLCQVFMGDPEKLVFLNFVDKTTVSGKSRTGTKSKREPDLVLELKDQSNKTVCELGLGEATSHAYKNHHKKNRKDLVRIGLGLKDAHDHIQDKFGIHNATLVGYQVIAQTMSIYLMRRCGNMYVMVHTHDVLIPDSMKELATIGAEYKIWFELALTVKDGIKSVLEAVVKEEVPERHPVAAGDFRFKTLCTPELNRLLSRRVPYHA
ncbi:hypothetical protein BGZ46_003311 [Entomortierella lignicola]|nr:hypothetical protein BGZ46_003311 [Entomortierella lignicola]